MAFSIYLTNKTRSGMIHGGFCWLIDAIVTLLGRRRWPQKVVIDPDVYLARAVNVMKNGYSAVKGYK